MKSEQNKTESSSVRKWNNFQRIETESHRIVHQKRIGKEETLECRWSWLGLGVNHSTGVGLTGGCNKQNKFSQKLQIYYKSRIHVRMERK